MQAKLMGWCWQHIVHHWEKKNKNGRLFAACPRGADCKMKHENPEQFTEIEQDGCVMFLEAYLENAKKKLFADGALPKAKAGPGGQQGNWKQPQQQQGDKKPIIPLCSNCNGDHWQQDCVTNFINMNIVTNALIGVTFQLLAKQMTKDITSGTLKG